MSPVSGDLCWFIRPDPDQAVPFVKHYRCDEHRDGTVTDAYGAVVTVADPEALIGFDRTPEQLRSAPKVATHGNYELTILDDQPIDEGKSYAHKVHVVITREGAPIRDFLLPGYQQWTLLAHWTEGLE